MSARHPTIHRHAADWLEMPSSDGGTIKVRKSTHPRARHLRLTVTAHGARLSCPHGTHPAKVFAFLRQHGAWLEGKLAELKVDDIQAPPLRVGVPDSLDLGGRRVQLLWEPARHAGLQQQDDTLRIRLPQPWDAALPRARNLLKDHLETCVRRDVAQWMPELVDRLGRAPNGLRLRVLKSLWGSLDTRDRISLDLSLAMAPREALRYVLAHELAHLEVRNHSRRFWQCVAHLMPDYDAQRVWLRGNGARLKSEMERLLG